jgi:glutaredoxin
MAKEYLSLKGYQFTEINVSQNKEGQEQLLALGFSTTPVTVIGNRVVDGLDIARIESALAEL